MFLPTASPCILASADDLLPKTSIPAWVPERTGACYLYDSEERLYDYGNREVV